MSEPELRDEEAVEGLLEVLRDDELEAPEGLPDRTIRRVQALITSRDIIDLTTVVFLLRFCAPLLELIAAAFATNLTDEDRRRDDG